MPVMNDLTETARQLLERSGLPCVRMGRVRQGTPLPHAAWRLTLEDFRAGRINVICRALEDDAGCLGALDRLLELVPERGKLLQTEQGRLMWIWRESASWERDAADPRLCIGRVSFAFSCCGGEDEDDEDDDDDP